MVFQLVSRRYERGSIILTSNKAFSEWGQVFSDDVLATAILDRLLHHCDVISINGPSYRLKDRMSPTHQHQHHAIITMPRTDTSGRTRPTHEVVRRQVRLFIPRLAGCGPVRRLLAAKPRRLGQLEPSDSSAMAGWASPTSRVPPADRALPSLSELVARSPAYGALV